MRNSDVNTALCTGKSGTQLFSLLRRYLVRETLAANQMLTLRIVVNMLSHPSGEGLVMEHKHFLLAVIRQLVDTKASKNLQVNYLFLI